MTNESREQTIAPCPMPGCGGECRCAQGSNYVYYVFCIEAYCGYTSRRRESPEIAIAKHNALCADVRRGREAARLQAKYDALSVERKERFVADMTELLSGKDEGYVAWLEDQNEALEQERDALRREVERLLAAVERWDESLGDLYSSNDLRGTDYFDYELRHQLEGEMQQEMAVLRAALDAGEEPTV